MGHWGRSWTTWALVLAGACTSTPVERSSPPTTSPPTSSAPATTAPSLPVRIDLAIEARPKDPATAGFSEMVRATLTDPRGWQQAGFTFAFRDDAPYRVVLAEGPEVDGLCRPYDVGGRYSCQNGPVVALNADRWRSASPKWTGDLETYRRMLVNHEVGHLLGQHHPRAHCPGRDQPAPVMAQQSSELNGCLPHPWPLPWELQCAARHEEPLAPGYEDHPRSSCGP